MGQGHGDMGKLATSHPVSRLLFRRAQPLHRSKSCIPLDDWYYHVNHFWLVGWNWKILCTTSREDTYKATLARKWGFSFLSFFLQFRTSASCPDLCVHCELQEEQNRRWKYQKGGVSVVLMSLKMLHTCSGLPCSKLPACERINLYVLSHCCLELGVLNTQNFLGIRS